MSELHVIFGTGPVGCWIARALQEMYIHVRVVNRSGKLPDLMPTGAEILKADVSDPTITSTPSNASLASPDVECSLRGCNALSANTIWTSPEAAVNEQLSSSTMPRASMPPDAMDTSKTPRQSRILISADAV